jgi:fumarate reductase subunit D
MENWEKAKTISSIVAAVIIPVVLLLVGNQFPAAIKERELQGKFVELAINLLRESPTRDKENLRYCGNGS